LLALSSLLGAWGAAGRYTLIAEVLPVEQHLPANAVLTVIGEVATIAGPPLAGLLIAWSNPAAAIGIDAASFATLALTYRLVERKDVQNNTDVQNTEEAENGKDARKATAGFGAIRHSPTLLGLLVLTFVFFFLFGPFYVAMPIHVAEDLHASAAVLGLYYTVFAVGAVAGGLIAGYLKRWSLWLTVVGFGVAMLPLGLGAPTVVSLVGFAVGGAIWAPYMSMSMALFQRVTPIEQLSGVLAANGTVTVLSVPLGTVLGGPLVTAFGARHTLLWCAVATVVLGVASRTWTRKAMT
jgi:DHA3 family macrolide efflux protein-like MFS transporter